MNFQSSFDYDPEAFECTCPPEEESDDNKNKKLGYQFVPIAFKKIRNPEWRRNNRCPLAAYAYMRSEIVRGVYSGDTYDLFHRYWTDNKFACAVSVRELAKAFGYKSTKKVREWLAQLFEEGAFEIETIPVPGKPKPANIYILGKNIQGKEIWYYDL